LIKREEGARGSHALTGAVQRLRVRGRRAERTTERRTRKAEETPADSSRSFRLVRSEGRSQRHLDRMHCRTRRIVQGRALVEGRKVGEAERGIAELIRPKQSESFPRGRERERERGRKSLPLPAARIIQTCSQTAAARRAASPTRFIPLNRIRYEHGIQMLSTGRPASRLSWLRLARLVENRSLRRSEIE